MLYQCQLFSILNFLPHLQKGVAGHPGHLGDDDDDHGGDDDDDDDDDIDDDYND